MKHTIIVCDLCGERIFKNGWLIDNGAVLLHMKELELFTQGLPKDLSPVIYPGWKRRKIHVCPKCVEKIKTLCNGGACDGKEHRISIPCVPEQGTETGKECPVERD